MNSLFLLVIIPLIVAEVHLVGPWVAERLLRWGTRWLPEKYRERYVDDWLGELDMVPGSLFKLAFAIRVLVRVPATERELTGRDALWLVVIKRLLAVALLGLGVALVAVNRLGKQMRGDHERADAFVALVAQELRRSPRRGRQEPPAWMDGTDEALVCLLESPTIEHGVDIDVGRTVFEFKATAKGRVVNGAEELGADAQVRRYLRFLEENQPPES